MDLTKLKIYELLFHTECVLLDHIISNPNKTFVATIFNCLLPTDFIDWPNVSAKSAIFAATIAKYGAHANNQHLFLVAKTMHENNLPIDLITLGHNVVANNVNNGFAGLLNMSAKHSWHFGIKNPAHHILIKLEWSARIYIVSQLKIILNNNINILLKSEITDLIETIVLDFSVDVFALLDTLPNYLQNLFNKFDFINVYTQPFSTICNNFLNRFESAAMAIKQEHFANTYFGSTQKQTQQLLHNYTTPTDTNIPTTNPPF